MTDSIIINELPSTKVGYYDIDESIAWDGSFQLAIQDARDGKLITLDVDLETHIEIFEFLENHPQIGSLAMLKKQGH